MKNIFVGGLKAGATVLLFVGLGGIAQAQDSATVEHLHGQARVSTDHVKWRKLSNGSVIAPGSLIQTADNTTLDLVLDKHDAGTVRILANSVLGVDQVSSQRAGDNWVEDVELDLQAGQITGTAGKPGPGSKYEIKFVRGIAGIRGAKYHMNSSGMVTTITGEVVVAMTAADGSAAVKVVAAGNQFDSGTGMVSVTPAGAEISEPPATVPPKTEPAPASENTESSTYKPPGALHQLRKF